MIYTFLLSLFVFAAPKNDGFTAESVVHSLKPEDVVVKIPQRIPAIDGSLLTLITGSGHGHSLKLITFKRQKSKVQIFVNEYSRYPVKPHTLRSSTKADRKYPEADFYYALSSGSISNKKFKQLVHELTKIHSMKTYKEYKINHRKNPVSFAGTNKNSSLDGLVDFSSSTANYVNLVNLWAPGDKGFFYAFSGYPGSDEKPKTIKVKAMIQLTNHLLKSVKLTQAKEITDEHRSYFHHQLATVKGFYNQEFWWWVKERSIGLTGLLGSKKHTSMLLEILANKKTQKPSEK